MKKFRLFFIACLLASNLEISKPNDSKTLFAMQFGLPTSVSKLPQDADALLASMDLSKLKKLSSSPAQRQHEYRQALLSVWTKTDLAPEVRALFLNFAEKAKQDPNACYGQNLRPVAESTQSHWLSNANLDQASMKRPGIVVYASALRILPTPSPCFKNPNTPGQGYPFDELQTSWLTPGTPVLIHFLSRDREWAFIETSFKQAGFVKRKDIASLNAQQTRAFENLDYGIAYQDGVAIHQKNGDFWNHSYLGMTVWRQGKHALLLKKDVQGKLELEKHPLFSWVAWEPWDFEAPHLRTLLKQLLGRPYGKGELLGERDCSSLIRSFLSVFRIPLNRSSYDQIIDHSEDLSSMSITEKKQKILQDGVPFRTMVYFPGHIELYIGTLVGQEEPLFLESRWGYLLMHASLSGRQVVGMSIVSTGDAEDSVEDFDSNAGNTWQRITRMKTV